MEKKKYLKAACENDSIQREAKEIIDNKGLAEFASIAAKKLDRRSFFGVMGGAAASLSMLNLFSSTAEAKKPDLPPVKYNAVYCSLGLANAWVRGGAATCTKLGEILGIKFKIYDAKFSIEQQRSQFETVASQAKDYDVVLIHPGAIGAYTAPSKKILKAGSLLVDIDTRLTKNIDDLDILCFTEPDNEYMGAIVTEEICKAMNYEGGIVETQGMLTHTGAQGRHRGFEKTVKKYSKIKILDQTPTNWDPNKAREIWENLLVKYGDKIKGGFFHNDGLALAAQSACKANGFEAGSKGIFLGGVDAIAIDLKEFMKGRMLATVANPTGRVHGYGLWAAYYTLARGEKKGQVPKHIHCDGPFYSHFDPQIRSKVDSSIWLSAHYLL